MKTIFVKIVYIILGFISVSVIGFGTGLFSSSHSGFADIRERLSYDFQDLYYDPAFSIEDKDIQSKELIRNMEHNAFIYDVFFDNDVLYHAYVDANGKGIRCCEVDGRVASNSFWYRISDTGLVRFNWMLLWEDLTLAIAFYGLPIILLIFMLL